MPGMDILVMKKVRSDSPEKLTSKLFLTYAPYFLNVLRNALTPVSLERAVVAFVTPPRRFPKSKAILRIPKLNLLMLFTCIGILAAYAVNK